MPITFTSRFGRANTRTIEVKIGARYHVEPQNPLKLKHRDRYCVLLELLDDQVDVRFEDNGRRGRVDLSDLVQAPAKT